MIKKRLLSVVAACALGLSNQAVYAADNLVEVLKLALDNDPTYQAAKSSKEATVERYNQAFSALLPSAGLSANYQDSSSDSTVTTTSQATGASTSFSGDTDSDSFGFQAVLNQLVYDHGVWIALSQSEKRSKQAEISLKSQMQQLIIRTARTYLNVLSSQDSLAFAKAEVEAIGQQLEQTKQRYQVGLIARTDVHEAQADYDRAVSNQIIAQNNVDIAHEALREITGRYHKEIAALTSKLELVSPQPNSIDQWVKIAEENNLSMQAQKMAVEISRSEIKRRFSGHYPNASFNVTYNDSETNSYKLTDEGFPGGDTFDRTTDSSGTTWRINFNVPIYSGGRTTSETREARHLFDQETHRLEGVYRQLQRETRSSYLGVIAGISSVKALQQSVISNQSALEATQAGFEVGTRTIVDVLLSTRALFRAKSELSRAKYDYILNLLTLKQSAGILTREDILKINSWLES